MSSLKLTGINKVYLSGAAALYNIDLETRDREFIVIVGGEKSGKSTLLRVIAGLEEATSGSVLIGGNDVTEVDPKDVKKFKNFLGRTVGKFYKVLSRQSVRGGIAVYIHAFMTSRQVVCKYYTTNFSLYQQFCGVKIRNRNSPVCKDSILLKV